MRRDRDEQGAVLILGAVFAAVAVVAAALAVDIGRLAQERRNLHRVADMAALDAVRDPANAATLAQASAQRNGFDPAAPGQTFGVVVGHLDPRTNVFTQGGTPIDSVEVTPGSTVKSLFVPGSHSPGATAVATIQGQAGFSIGSSLVSISTSQSTLLNPILTQMIGSGTNLSFGAATYNGLVDAGVTLGELGSELVALGVSAGTPQQLLASQVTLTKLYTATANALTKNGDVADASVFNVLATNASGSAKITLGDLIGVSQGYEAAAAAAELNLFELVTGSAALANGNHAVTLSNVGVTVPGVSSTSLSLTLGEGPVFAFGPVYTSVRTKQVNLTVTPVLNVAIPGVATIGGSLPITVTGGDATGTLTAVNCFPPESITVEADTAAAEAWAAAILSVTLPLVGTIPALNTTLDSKLAPGQTVLPFAYTNEFTEPVGPKNQSKHAGATSLSLGTSVNVSSPNPLLQPLLDQLLAALAPVLDGVDAQVIQQLSSLFGLSIGGADVAATSLSCGIPTLVH